MTPSVSEDADARGDNPVDNDQPVLMTPSASETQTLAATTPVDNDQPVSFGGSSWRTRWPFAAAALVALAVLLAMVFGGVFFGYAERQRSAHVGEYIVVVVVVVVNVNVDIDIDNHYRSHRRPSGLQPAISSPLWKQVLTQWERRCPAAGQQLVAQLQLAVVSPAATCSISKVKPSRSSNLISSFRASIKTLHTNRSRAVQSARSRRR